MFSNGYGVMAFVNLAIERQFGAKDEFRKNQNTRNQSVREIFDFEKYFCNILVQCIELDTLATWNTHNEGRLP